MRRIQGVVGNVDDDPTLEEQIATHASQGTLEHAHIDAEDRKKSRLRLRTDAGTDLGLIASDGDLRSGDVLVLEEGLAIILAFQAEEALVIECPEIPSDAVPQLIELGHRVGNHHWDLAIEDQTIYVELAADRHIVEDVVAGGVPAGASVSIEAVPAELFVESTNPPAHHH